ncbi:leucine-rich repeat-containing protein 15-like isoform X1 [Ctenocephalides felis]|uniref:leucine-rich repeat-containing protein 15-like isoform X1 n=2 Tax=Ctenocephalides felis TaxID=7515 RepID=UPI000E6E459C|nr:leucine-rich repeat-containing protein 15-like isoform X1 [Ctenocephalides felis]
MNFIKLLLVFVMIDESFGNGYCNLEECNCYIDDAKFVVDCSEMQLKEIPNDIPKEAQILIMTNNNIQELSGELKSLENLEELYFSGNRIRKISSDAIANSTNLKKIILSRNNLTSLTDIHASELFILAKHLIEIDLSQNPITLDRDYERMFIHNQQLQILNLSHCQIHSLTHPKFLKYMPNLQILDLSFNPLNLITNMQSSSLVQLEVSHCQLGFFDGNSFNHLTGLMKLNIAWNPRLYFSRRYPLLKLESLKELDISFCNVNKLRLEAFPKLVNLKARGNMVNELNEESFEKNHLLEYINLSGNGIASVTKNTFVLLDELRMIDLSWNVLSSLNPNTFAANKQLTSINLSRNHLNRLDSFVSKSIDTLDLSWCEIQHISNDAFVRLPELIDLNLSHNLISEIPERLQASKLQKLDLTFCRLKTLRNETLQGMPFLSTLLLGGNRMTTPFHESYFSGNHALKEIDLSDNPWRCECMSESFKNLFKYLRPRVDDIRALKCESPNVVAGKSWSSACGTVWNPNLLPVSKADKFWMFLIVILLSFVGTMCVVMVIRRTIKARAEAARREEERVAEEARERQRQQRLLEREAMRNAPDPRDLVSPPCYEEALLLPRLDGTFASLGHLPSGSRDLQNKMGKNRAKSEANVSKIAQRGRNLAPLTISVHQEHPTQSATELATNVNNSESSSSTARNSDATMNEANANSQQNETPITRIIPSSPPPKYSERNPIPVEVNVTVEAPEGPTESMNNERVRRESDL